MFQSKINVLEYDAGYKKLALYFQCGNTVIDDFLKNDESLNHRFGKTYIWLTDDQKEIIGYYNISTGSVDYIDNGKQYKMGGSIHINEFAVDAHYQRTKMNETPLYYSDALLYDCISRIEFIQQCYVGFPFITLESTSEGYKLYTRNNFEELENDMKVAQFGEEKDGTKRTPMYLPLDVDY